MEYFYLVSLTKSHTHTHTHTHTHVSAIEYFIVLMSISN